MISNDTYNATELFLKRCLIKDLNDKATFDIRMSTCVYFLAESLSFFYFDELLDL